MGDGYLCNLLKFLDEQHFLDNLQFFVQGLITLTFTLHYS